MGVFLNSLGNLSVDDDVDFYVFVINGQWVEPLYQMVEANFEKIARSIGGKALIAVGTDPKLFTNEISKAYLGENCDLYRNLLPAMIVTNDHPDRISSTTVRLVIPLTTAEERFGGWSTFFDLLSRFVRNEDNEFLKKFQDRSDALDDVNKTLKLNVGFGGVGVHLNEFIAWWAGRQDNVGRLAYT